MQRHKTTEENSPNNCLSDKHVFILLGHRNGPATYTDVELVQRGRRGKTFRQLPVPLQLMNLFNSSS